MTFLGIPDDFMGNSPMGNSLGVGFSSTCRFFSAIARRS